MGNLTVAVLVLVFFLAIGTIGYHMAFDKQSINGAKYTWIDAFHNASMILSGMGPVVTELTNAGKIFSSIYAMFSGVLFISVTGYILAPVIHRFFHKIHIDEK